MGFILKKKYNVEKLGITIPTAYAKISNINIDNDCNAIATFDIQQTREDVESKRPLESINVIAKIDKDKPIYEQMYVFAKAEQFANWKDDIVETTEETNEELTETEE